MFTDYGYKVTKFFVVSYERLINLEIFKKLNKYIEVWCIFAGFISYL